MLSSVLFALMAAATTCLSAISLRAPARIEGQPAVCVQYASVPLERNATLIVYAIEATARRDDDVPHRVFVALGSARRDITSSVMSNGEPGYFQSMRVVATPFRLGGEQLVDVAIGSTISGSGGISSASDLIFSARGNLLRLRARLDDTEGGARGGVSYTAETTSELLVASQELILVRQRRIARRRVADEPFVVHCDVTRTAYSFEQSGSKRSRPLTESELRRLRNEGRPLPRLEHRQLIPCCKGCKVSE